MKRLDDKVAAATGLPGDPEAFCDCHRHRPHGSTPSPRFPFFSVAASARTARLLMLIALSAVLTAGCNKADQASSPALGAPNGAAKAATAYVANSNSRIVHRADCKYSAAMKPEHRVEFRDLPNAIAEGYKPCRDCLRAAATRAAATIGPEENKP